jgi:murein L,D-transpeptidase YcbB/YkuD
MNIMTDSAFNKGLTRRRLTLLGCAAALALLALPVLPVNAESIIARIPVISGLIQKASLRETIGKGLDAREFADAASLKSFYEDHGFTPLWTGTDAKLAQAKKVEEVLQRSWSHGLNPRHYHASEISELLKQNNPDQADRLELLISDAVMRYGHDINGMRLNPNAIRQDAKYWRPSLTWQGALEVIAKSDDPSGTMEAMAPQDALYKKLRAELIALARAEAGGSTKPLDFGGQKLIPGRSYEGISALRERLKVEQGDAPVDLYDPALADAVRAFQKARGMKVDGIIGAKTLELMNRSSQSRMRQIVVNMERLRWMDQAKPDRYVLVNIPSQMLWAVDQGKVAMQMPVVVGKPDRPTKAFRTDITGIRFNPRWTVPQSIKMKDFLPILKDYPGILAEKNINLYKIIDGKRVMLDPAKIDWHNVSAAEMNRMHMVQVPGDHNSLGLIRVLMPNEYDIYLHDTNHRELFTQSERFLSSGCIRLSDPVRMAEFVLEHHKGWENSRMQKLVARGNQTDINVEQKLPIYIVYLTAWLDDRGDIVYGQDIYGQDSILLNVMDKTESFWLPGKSMEKAELTPEKSNAQLAEAKR